MKSKITKWTLAFFMLFFIFQTGTIANADDDDEGERYERHEHEYEDREYEGYEYGEDDDDESYYEENTTNYGDSTIYESKPVQSTFWNLWTREISSSNSNTELPFQEAKEVSIELNNTSESFFIIPQNGQLLVPGEKVAKFIGAESHYYQQSKILELSKGKDGLIIRAGTNAAYENMAKTPMPTQSFYYEKSIYLPISVIANALGYRVNWDAAKSVIILQEI